MGKCAVLVAVLAACGDDSSGGGGEPEYTITAPGAGDANAAALMPIGVGYEGLVPDSGETMIVDGTIAHAGEGTLYRAVGVDGGWVQWLLVRDDGVFAAGNTTTGLLAHPVLIAPTTVRDGMTWTAADLTFVVTRTMTPHAWTITATANTPGAYPDAYTYYEGLGIRDNPRTLLVPRMPVDNPLPRAAIAMDPMAVPADGGIALNHLSMIRRPTGGALFTTGEGIGMLGSSPRSFCVTSADGASLAAGAAVRDNAITSRSDLSCVLSGVSDVDEGGITLTQYIATGQATSAFVRADGTIFYFARTPGGGIAKQDRVQVQLDLGWRPLFFQPGAGDVPTVAIDCINCAHDTSIDRVPFDVLVSGDNFTPERDAVPWDQVWVSGVTAIRDDEGGTSVVLTAGDGTFWGSTMDGPPHLFGRLPGLISAQTSVDGTELLRLTGDGGVDRIHASHGALWLEHLGEAQIPVGDIPEAAFVWHAPTGDHLLVFSSVYDDSFLGSEVHAWRSSSALPAGTRLTQPAVMQIQERGVAGGAAMVCGVSGDASAMGWTLDGAAALVFPQPGTSCALVVPPAPNGEVLEGPLPGVGLAVVNVATGGGSFDYAWAPDDVIGSLGGAAPVPGDRFVTDSARIGPGAVSSEPAPIASHIVAEVPDRAGHGLWLDTADGMVLRGPTTDLAIANSQGMRVRTGAIGGGVTAQAGADMFVLRPDGSQQQLPAGYGPVVFTDGSSCGVTATVAFCLSAAGSLRSVPLATGDTGAAYYYPLRDGSILLRFIDTSTLETVIHRARLVPQTMAFTDLGREAFQDDFASTGIDSYAVDGTPFIGTASVEADGLHQRVAPGFEAKGPLLIGERMIIAGNSRVPRL